MTDTEKKMAVMSESKRRSHLGIEVLKCGENNLGQLSAVHTELKNCLAIWKNQHHENMSRKAIISVLQQIALADNPPFKKSKFIRDSVKALGCKSVHNVPTKLFERTENYFS